LFRDDDGVKYIWITGDEKCRGHNAMNTDGIPQEYDVVRLLRPLPEHNLAAGATGAVVTDYDRFSRGDRPPAYEVEFTDENGATLVLVTVQAGDLEVVQRG
jgi:hypothetical protein